MSNSSRNRPAAGKSVAGKNNSGHKNSLSDKELKRRRSQADKDAKRLQKEKERRQLAREKKSADIHKRREAQNKRELKLNEKKEQREIKESKRQIRSNSFKKFLNKLRYYTSRRFLKSFNYGRIFMFVILPAALIVFGSVSFAHSAFANVPGEIRNFTYEGRTETGAVVGESVFNSQQISVFTSTLKSHGSRKFKFYINSRIHIDDDGKTTDLCFGNPSENGSVIIATIFDKDGKILYRSLGLEPGYEMNNVTFFEKLPYGTHNVKVCVNAYDAASHEKIGTRYAKIQLLVGVDSDG